MLVCAGKKRRIDIQNVVHVKAVDVDHLIDGHIAHVGHFDGGAGVDRNQPLLERGEFFRAHQIGLGNENAVGKSDLIKSHLFLGDRFVGMLGVNKRHHAVKAEKGRDRIIHKEGLADGAGIGHTRGFDDDVIKINLAFVTLDAQVREHARQIAADRTADAAVVHRNDLFGAVLHKQIVVNGLFAEFVFDHGDLAAVVFLQDAVQKRRLAGTQKAREHCDRNIGFGHRIKVFRHFVLSFHHNRKSASTKAPSVKSQSQSFRCKPLRYSPSGNVISSG